MAPILMQNVSDTNAAPSERRPPVGPRPAKLRWIVLAAVLAALVLFVVPLGARIFLVEAFKIPSAAMTPTLIVGDHIFVYKLAYGFEPKAPPQRGDIVVFRFPENREMDFVKRIIAGGGDTLEAINGRPVINGWLVPHCRVGKFQNERREAELFVEYLEDKSFLTLYDLDPDEVTCTTGADCGAGLSCRSGICGQLQGPFRTQKGEAWVMGDNRNNTYDSRFWRGGVGVGVPYADIKGRAMFVWTNTGAMERNGLFEDLHRSPFLPTNQANALRESLAKCLKDRPPVEKTTPPGPKG